MCKLLFNTPPNWVEAIMADFDAFLLDHAAAEKKASGMAMSMVSHYPDKPELVKAMTELAIEELNHFKEVTKIIYARGLQLGADTKDDYINQFRKLIRTGPDDYMLDRLLVAAIVEARGAERFGLIAAALTDNSLKHFYEAITRSEQRHFKLFHDLAILYFDNNLVAERLEALLHHEADIVASLPITPALH